MFLWFCVFFCWCWSTWSKVSSTAKFSRRASWLDSSLEVFYASFFSVCLWWRRAMLEGGGVAMALLLYYCWWSLELFVGHHHHLSSESCWIYSVSAFGLQELLGGGLACLAACLVAWNAHHHSLLALCYVVSSAAAAAAVVVNWPKSRDEKA